MNALNQVEEPRVSVVMPVYNVRRFIQESVESILQQTFRNFEFLIFDDGSTDGSLEILREYASRDPRVFLLERQHGGGYLKHLNEGIEMARGEYIARMDADDVSSLSRFESEVRFLDRHPECVAVGSQTIIIGPDGKKIGEILISESHEQINADILNGRNCGIAQSAVMYRRETIRSIGGYRAEYEWAEDTDLWLRLGECGRLANLPDYLLKYRVHLSSVCHTKTTEQGEKGRLMIREACLRRKIPIPSWIDENAARPPRTKIDIYCRWAGIAQNSSNWTGAFKYSIFAALTTPLSIKGWRLIYQISRNALRTFLKKWINRQESH